MDHRPEKAGSIYCQTFLELSTRHNNQKQFITIMKVKASAISNEAAESGIKEISHGVYKHASNYVNLVSLHKLTKDRVYFGKLANKKR